MPNIKPRSASTKEILQSFGGIGANVSKSTHVCKDLQNFRILEDGSLEKRCGFKKQLSFNGALRGFWNGFLNGNPLTCAVAGSELYIKKGTSFVKSITLTSLSGLVRFVQYRDFLYLLDGTAIYVYQPLSENFQKAQGYAPLIGYCWSPTTGGADHEAVNLFTNRMRIHFKNLEGSTTYNLPYRASSIDVVYADGKKISDYSFSTGSTSFTVNEVYSWLEVSFTTMINDEDIGYINSSTRVFCEQLNGQEYLFLYGARSGNYLFGSKPVDKSMLTSCQSAYRLADPLYCPLTMKTAAGTPSNPITTLVLQHERILAFHDNGALSLQITAQSEITAYPLLSGYGCTASLPPILVGDQIIIVNHGGIFALSSNASDRDRFEIEPISAGIPELQSETFTRFAEICFDAAHGELWCCDRLVPEKTWIYHIKQKCWYTFTGFSPSYFLIYQGYLGFAEGTSLYLFDDTKNTDDGAPIVAVMTSDCLFTSVPEERKRVSRVTLLTRCGNNQIDLLLKTERGERNLRFLDTDGQELPTLLERRICFGRFRLLQIALTDSGSYRTRIYRLAVFANS